MKTSTRSSSHRIGAVLALALALPSAASAFVLSFTDADFTTAPEFSTVETFTFSIDVSGPLAPGVYNNPMLNGVDYTVTGSLVSGTPSGFSAFALVRDIGGAEFYAQGSSLTFEIAAGANLADGLQFSELAGTTGAFVFDGHENNTGRFHPALLQLNSDGTGSIRNSDNMGAGPGMNIDVDFGAEYITNLTFDPAALTLAAPIPVPAAAYLLGSALVLAGAARRRRQTAIAVR